MIDKSGPNLLARGGLLVNDVADLFTEVKQELENLKARGEGRAPEPVNAVSERTVVSFVDFSQPRGRSVPAGTRLPEPGRKNRYQDDPMPLPIRIRNQVLVWVPDDDENPTLDHVRDALRRWYHERLKRD